VSITTMSKRMCHTNLIQSLPGDKRTNILVLWGAEVANEFLGRESNYGRLARSHSCPVPGDQQTRGTIRIRKVLDRVLGLVSLTTTFRHVANPVVQVARLWRHVPRSLFHNPRSSHPTQLQWISAENGDENYGNIKRKVKLFSLALFKYTQNLIIPNYFVDNLIWFPV
jgi:hypothetical protein